MEELKPKHSPIGASSMYRWSTCPASIKLSEGIENKSGVAAMEGTAAHEFIGLALQRAFSENKPTAEIVDEHVKAIKTYSTFIEKLREQIKDPVTHVEHSFDMSRIYPNLYGTADCVVYDHKRQVLYVIDYKHGVALPVEVENNKQLSYYALGALTTLPYRPRWVELVIVQPRCYHPAGPIRNWRVPVTYFIDFKADLIVAAKETENPKAALVVGDHCLFCPAKKTKCPAQSEQKLEKGKSLFSQNPAHNFNFYKDPKKVFKPV